MPPAQRLEAKQRSDRFHIAMKRSWKNGGHSTSSHFHLGPFNADTVRYHAREDARGTTVFTVILPDKSTVILQHSVSGRVDQFDLVWNGQITFTGRANLCMGELVEMSGGARAEREEVAGMIGTVEIAA